MRSPSTAAIHPRSTLVTVFLTLFIDLVGFSIIFPLFPAILAFYLPLETDQNGFFSQLITSLRGLAQHHNPNAAFMTTVLFGGILGSLYALLQFLVAPLWGRLSDRIGRRPVLIITILGTALSYLIWILSGSFYLLLIARILGGIMCGNLAVATAAIADITSREHRVKGMAIVGMAFGLGFILGPAIGGLSSEINLLDFYPEWSRWGINPFSFPAGIAFMLALLNLFRVVTQFKETSPLSQEKPDDRPAALSQPLTPCIRWAYLINFIVILAFSGMEFTLMFLAVERLNFTPSKNGLLFVFMGLLMILTYGLVRHIAPRFGEKRLVSIGIGLGALGFVGIAHASELIPFLMSQALFAFGFGLFNPNLVTLVSLYASESTQGRHLGTFRSAGSLARATGPLITTTFYFYFGSRFAYLTAALIMLSPLMLISLLRDPHQQVSDLRACKQ